jgi:hypothetical protein
MKTSYLFVAAVLSAGLLASCVEPYAPETGPTPLRTSGAYSAQFRGSGSTFHSRDARDPRGDWRHDDAEDDDDDDALASRGYAEPGSRYTSTRVWRPESRSPAELPSGAQRVMVEGRTYYTVGNVWYQPVGTGFRVVTAPY